MITIVKIFYLTFLLAGFIPQLAFSDIPKTLYGYDDRHEALYYFDPHYIDATQAVGGLVYNNKLKDTTSSKDVFEFEKILAIRAHNLCPTERFNYQNVLTRCSAFLISEDLMLTAGHCISTQQECSNVSVVFSYYLGTELILKKNVFRCAEIVETKLENKLLSKHDYTIFRIDRKTDRIPLELDLRNKPKKNTPVITIGHPLGLPMKTTDGGVIKKNHLTYFITNLDTYGGNSGSPVFNQETGKVIGLVSFGQEDWEQGVDPATGFSCRTSKLHSNDSQEGERVFRLSKIKSLKKHLQE